MSRIKHYYFLFKSHLMRPLKNIINFSVLWRHSRTKVVTILFESIH